VQDIEISFFGNLVKAGFAQATLAKLRSRAVLHFEVVWLD
jgi:hypothetical protein